MELPIPNDVVDAVHS